MKTYYDIKGGFRIEKGDKYRHIQRKDSRKHRIFFPPILKGDDDNDEYIVESFM